MENLKITTAQDATGAILGMLDNEGNQTVSFDNLNENVNQNMLVFSTDNKESTNFCKTMLAQIRKRRESVILSDPTGDLFQETSEYFRNFGYEVKCINFKDSAAISFCWNLMSELGPRDDAETAQERARLFANTVVSNAMPDASGLFRDCPIGLLMAVLLRVHLDSSMPDSIDEVIDIISNPAGEEYLDQIFDEGVLQGNLQCCLGYYSVFKSCSANWRKQNLSVLTDALIPLKNERVRMILSCDGGIDLTMLGKEPCAYYIQFPAENENYKFLASLVFAYAYQDLVDYADTQPNRKCAVPVNILLNQAQSVGIIPLFPQRLAVTDHQASLVAWMKHSSHLGEPPLRRQ